MLLLPVADAKGASDNTLFRFLVKLEVAKAQRLRYCVSVVSLAIDDANIVRVDLNRLTEHFVNQVRATDIIVRNPESSWTLLLVDAQPQALASIVHRLTEQLGTLSWSAGGASYPGTALDSDDLLCQAVESGAWAQEDGRHEIYLHDVGLHRGQTG